MRGTWRLLQLASSQVLYLYLGCVVLLILLPFSLAIPHFVSTTLAALGCGSTTAVPANDDDAVYDDATAAATSANGTTVASQKRTINFLGEGPAR